MSTTDCSSYCTSNENCSNIQVTVHKVTYVWVIDNFGAFETIGSILRSPVFSTSTNDKIKWYIKLKPNGNTNNKDTISLHLHLSESGVHTKTIFAKNTISIIDDQKKEVSKSSLEVRKFAAGSGWGWQEFCKKDENFRRKLLSNNALRIFCEVTFFQESDILAALNSTIPNCDISENLDTLLRTHQLADVVVSAKSKEYLVHKAILAARSRVFAAMFLHDTKENQSNRVDIEDMSEEVVSEMLSFIYTGRCEKLDEFAGELLAAADKYDLGRLKIMCSQTLSKNLSVENAANILILADMYNVNELKSEAIKVVVAKSIEVFNTAGWKNVVTNPRLIDEVCRAIALR